MGRTRSASPASRQVGFDLNAGPREVTLSVGGQPVQFEWVGQGNDLGIRFEGMRLAPDSYMPRNVYWLKAGAAPPRSSSDRTHPYAAERDGSCERNGSP